MDCELCSLIKDKKKEQIYFETDEIIVIEKNENLVVGMIKEHTPTMEDGKASGLIKVMMKIISKNKYNSTYTFKKADDCKDHFGIYATIQIK